MERAWERMVRGGAAMGGWVGLLGLLLLAGSGEARAFDDPAVRSARLAYLHGDVTVSRADNTGSDTAQINMPLLEGVQLTTAGDGEAEVEFEDGSLLRVTPASSVVLVRLGSGSDGNFRTEVALLNGLVYAELRAASKYAYRVDAGEDKVTPVANATVRIRLDQPPAEVAVLDGTAHVERGAGGEGSGYQTDVRKGESMRGDPGGGRYFLSQGIPHDSWDDWNEAREQAAADELAGRTAARDAYAGDQGYGWSDLDANGTWYDAGTQGPVWQPYDASVSGFDPYGYGSWVWYPVTGYVWSSGYSWGWTPFRCGRWNYWKDFGWGWVPANTCGLGGWGFGGGYGGGGGRVGRPTREVRINLSNVPPGYKRPLPPVVGGPVRVHPIVQVHSGPPQVERRGSFYEARPIAGQTATPLHTVGGGYTPRGGSAVGSSLRRDFPVDRVTRQPVIGTVVAPPAGRREADGRRSAGPGGGGVTGPVSAPVGAPAAVLPGAIVVGSGPVRDRGDREERPVRRTAPAGRTEVPPNGSSVAAPPPNEVIVRPGRVEREGEPAENRMRRGPEMQRAIPAQPGSVPAPPPVVRSAPPAAAPAAPVRSAPPTAAPTRSVPAPEPRSSPPPAATAAPTAQPKR